MTLFGNFPGSFRIQFIFQKQELFMEVFYGILQWPSMLTAECECSCNSYCTDGIQPIRVLNDLSFQCLRMYSPVPAERYGVNCFAYFI